MSLTAREGKHLAQTANCLETIVRILEAQHRNTMEIHRVLTEISAKLDKPAQEESRCNCAECRARKHSVKDANQLELPNVVASQSMRCNDKYQPDDQGRLKPYEWRHNLGLETFFDQHSPRENEQMTEDEFRVYDGGL